MIDRCVMRGEMYGWVGRSLTGSSSIRSVVFRACEVAMATASGTDVSETMFEIVCFASFSGM